MAESDVRRHIRPYVCAILSLYLFVFLLCPRTSLAGGGPRNVLVVANASSDISRDIASYYQRARHIPQKNVLYLICPTTELVTRDVCENQIRRPIHDYLQQPDMTGIDYIVLVKGIPLRADYGHYSGNFSVTSVLTCASDPTIQSYLINPYGPQAATGWGSPAPETYWSSTLTFNGHRFHNVTRLDAFTVEDVKRMIDHAVSPPVDGNFALDKRTNVSGAYRVADERLGAATDTAYAELIGNGKTALLDDTPGFISGASGLVGYFSWGSNDPAYTYTCYTGNGFLPGSIGDTYYSFSARTFIDPGTPNRGSLIADLFPTGLSGASGYVSEPYLSTATFPNVLFDRYTKGYNMAESFFAACTELFWKTVFVGDPLMAPFATPPTVTLLGLDGPLTGSAASLAADASDASGIAKVEFYIDDTLVGTALAPPYEVEADTNQFIVGPHTVEAIAYENSPVYTQGSARAEVQIINDVSNLARISQALAYADGQIVSLTGKTVTAGTGSVAPGFYVEEADRSSGMYVTSSTAVSEGDVVDLLGAVATTGGQRAILQAVVTVKSSGAPLPKPLGMSNAVLGGGPVGTSTPGVTGGAGVRNTALLVRTWGQITATGDGYFYIDDGSHRDDGSGRIGIKVIAAGASPAGSWVAVTGISSREIMGDYIVPVILVRRASDILAYR